MTGSSVLRAGGALRRQDPSDHRMERRMERRYPAGLRGAGETPALYLHPSWCTAGAVSRVGVTRRSRLIKATRRLLERALADDEDVRVRRLSPRRQYAASKAPSLQLRDDL